MHNKNELKKKSYLRYKNRLLTLGTNKDTTIVFMYHLQSWLFELPVPNMKDIAPQASYHLIYSV
jgi:hypothetical protein